MLGYSESESETMAQPVWVYGGFGDQACPTKIQLLTFLQGKAKSLSKDKLHEFATRSTREGGDSAQQRRCQRSH